MTMLAEFSCQIILQKSFTVSCIGPGNGKGDAVRGYGCKVDAERFVSQLFHQGSI